MSNADNLAIGKSLQTALIPSLGTSNLEPSPNDYMCKLRFPQGAIVLYTNAKGGWKVMLHEIKDAAFKESAFAATSRIAEEGLPKPLASSPPTPVLQIPEEQPTPNAHPFMMLTAYTDGSAERGQCGWGVYIQSCAKHEVEKAFGNLGPQPSQQIAGEVEAAIHAIKTAIARKAHYLEIRYDYRGIGMWNADEFRSEDKVLKTEKQWRAKDPDAKNLVAWAQHAKALGLQLKFVWTKAHVGTQGNEVADDLALQGTLQKPTPRTGPPPTKTKNPEHTLTLS
jgi:ribonuclease HI